MLACCLHHQKTKGISKNSGHGKKHPNDRHCLLQFLSLCILSLCCQWIYSIIFKYDAIAMYTSHSHVLLITSQLITSCSFSFVLFSFLVSKSHPSFNHYLFSLLASLTSFCSTLSAFPTYLILSHFLICFECIFLFDHNMGHSYNERAIVIAYVIFLTIVCHAILKELIFAPSQRALEVYGNFCRKMSATLFTEAKLGAVEAATDKPKESIG